MARDISQRVRVFIGTEDKTEIARKVLECSIQRHTESIVDFTPMIGKQWEYKHDDIPIGTGFSLRRWMIPAYCDWQGRAIYLDADQLVFGDIHELWSLPDLLPTIKGQEACSAWMTFQPDKYNVKPAPQSSVMVIDCAKAKAQWGWHLEQVLTHLREEPTKERYAKFMHCAWMKPPCRQIEIGWNHLNVYKDKVTKLLHYTKEPEQPWYAPEHALANLWQKELMVAIRSGLLTKVEFKAALDKWGVKEDWRATNGLHPYYTEFLPLFEVRGKKS